MDASYYVRLLRLRWKVLAVTTLIGVAAGLGTLLISTDEPGPRETYWTAAHRLIVNPDATATGRYPNLPQTALLATGGSVPAAVAQQLGLDETELVSRVRTITDLEVSVIEISAVAKGLDATAAAAEATKIADLLAEALVADLGAADLTAYRDLVATAQSDVAATLDVLDEAEIAIEALEAERDALVIAQADPAPTPASDDTETPVAPVRTIDDIDDDLRQARIVRDKRFSAYQDATDALDQLERQGEPAPLMMTLTKVEAYEIEKKAYDRRIDEGRTKNNNFNRRTLEDDGRASNTIARTVSNPAVRGGLGGVAGLVLGLAAVLIHVRFDPRLRTRSDVEEAFDLPVIAEIPRFDKGAASRLEVHALTRTRSPVTEAYRVLRSALLFASSNPDPGEVLEPIGRHDAGVVDQRDVRVIMVTSPGPSEGKTTTAANLSVVLAEAGYEVLVVNCDYRIPKLHRYFKRPLQPRRTLETGISGVTLVGDVSDVEQSRNPTAVVEAQRALIEKARGRFDVVVLDTAPLLATNDAAALLPVVDLVVIVAREGRTDRDAAHEAVDLLRRRGATVAGVVLTAASGFGRSRHYLRYRYGHYYDAEDRRERGRGRKWKSKQPSDEAVRSEPDPDGARC
jgi:Mrp family chromosome partitioning ATPase